MIPRPSSMTRHYNASEIPDNLSLLLKHPRFATVLLHTSAVNMQLKLHMKHFTIHIAQNFLTIVTCSLSERLRKSLPSTRALRESSIICAQTLAWGTLAHFRISKPVKNAIHLSGIRRSSSLQTDVSRLLLAGSLPFL